MGVRRRKETPKVEVKEEPADFANAVSEEALAHINHLDAQVQERVEGLLDLRAALQQSVREIFQLQLIKLPKKVRDMPLKQFKEEFGGDIKSVLLEDMEQRLAASSAGLMPATGLRTRAKGGATAMPTQRRAQRRAAVAETPALGTSLAGPAETILRAPRGNEILYSKNGSPLGFLEQKAGQAPVLMTQAKPQAAAQPVGVIGGTVLQQARPGSKTGVADSVSIVLKSGEQVQVDFDGGIENVPEHQQAEVLAHLTALQKLATSITGRRRRR